jgi:hypothetical protein
MVLVFSWSIFFTARRYARSFWQSTRPGTLLLPGSDGRRPQQSGVKHRPNPGRGDALTHSGKNFQPGNLILS